ncbi:hypothetical protein O181_045017 [Austropuccinia psidii MF-1]|uniref:Uncharacterized protein n=1 Tax=Austropuccinia psidii MF-1 TaxID=1389203 RepID=A0A9Q3HIC1_9BASI|nr:hypothetical protein [Austropuccinia psidii MF-1]
MQSQLAQTLHTRVQDPQIGALSSGKCFKYGQNPYGIHSKGEGKDGQEFYMQMIQEIQFVNISINVELGKIDAKLTKIKSDINDFKKNDRASAEFNKSTIDRLDIICNTCDRIESKFQVEDDEMEEIYTKTINEQVTFPKNQVLDIVKHTNQFSTHLARSDSERQKLNDQILAHVEQIHKNYEQSPHMPRHSKPFTEEKLSVKGSLTPFLGKNKISAKNIPRLE